MSEIADYIARPCGSLADLVKLQARARPDHIAVVCEGRRTSYAALDALADRVAARLAMDGVAPGDAVAICATSSAEYVAVLLGTLRAGAAIAPLSPASTVTQLAAMLRDSGARHIFLNVAGQRSGVIAVHRAPLDTDTLGEPLGDWLAPSGSAVPEIPVDPARAFNIIYSSGTTGTPKGIIQSYRMRWPHNHLANPPGYGPDAVTLVSTGLYSNTTLVAVIPTLAGGGTLVLMPKFDARRFLQLSAAHRVTHAMLVPIQYRRILDVPDFDAFDLSSYRLKFATSSPFAAELKAEVLRRWPGGLIEYYGMTEGGGSCMLVAHEHPNKLATVGRPMPGHDIRVIGPDGTHCLPGEVGEVVGRSGAMMTGYHNRPDQTAEAEWTSPEGERFIRTGDLAMVDDDGFFTLMGRRKDVIISGGMNIYPGDLEGALMEHPDVDEAAVIGVSSAEWGETPVGFVTLVEGRCITGDEVRSFANTRLGRMQRLNAVFVTPELPRNAIGKILKTELRAMRAVQVRQS